MTEGEGSTENQNDLLLGLSLVERLIILFFGVALLFAISLLLQETEVVVQAGTSTTCDSPLSTNQINHTSLYSKEPSMLTDCDNQGVELQSSHQSSENTVIEQRSLIESLKQEQLVLIQAVEESAFLAAPQEENSAAEEQLQLISDYLKEQELYALSTLVSIRNIIDDNKRLIAELDSHRGQTEICQIDVEEASQDPQDDTTYPELPGDHALLQEDNKECLVRLDNQRKKFNLDYPACWEIENGQPDYIFNIRVTSTGYDVQRSYPDKREARALTIPGVLELQGKTLDQDELTANADKTYQWSKERNCRHYVRVSNTENTTDKIYKQRLKQLQSYFYTFEPKGGF